MSSIGTMPRRLLNYLAVTLALLISTALPASASLKGVTKATVEVHLVSNDRAVVTEDRLRTLTELRLRTAGLRVLSAAEDSKDPDVNPTVELRLTLLKVSDRGNSELGYAFATRVSVRDYRPSPRNGAYVPQELWANSFLNTTGNAQPSTDIEKVVSELLDDLLNDWLKANPK